jgi:hypothetical protein
LKNGTGVQLTSAHVRTTLPGADPHVGKTASTSPDTSADSKETVYLREVIINLLLWTGVRDQKLRTWDEAEAAETELIQQTMGQLKRALMRLRSDIDDAADLLIRAVRLRNFLAHEYFRQRAAAFVAEDSRDRMIEELKEAATFFQEVDGKLSPLTREIIETKGLGKY